MKTQPRPLQLAVVPASELRLLQAGARIWKPGNIGPDPEQTI
jgi:hypothetical protein